MKQIAIGLIVSFVAATATQAATLNSGEAREHVGETATVCDTVASAHYAPTSRGQPTFLNLGHPYPNPDFTVVIWGEDRAKFGTPEALEGHRVCVTGSIRSYRGGPEVIATDPGQVKE
ncbi:MAG: hypothetical protein JO264_13930 [Acidisphaera sp.]|nr:hypothetical protein [Acidisphaera sp.]